MPARLAQGYGEQWPPSLRRGQLGPVRPGLGDPCSGTRQSTPLASSGKSGPHTLYLSGGRPQVSLLWRRCHQNNKGIRSGVLGGWTEPPEARHRDPRETSASTRPDPRFPKPASYLRASLPLPLASSTALQLPTQAWANTGSHCPTQAPPGGGRGTGFQPPLVPGPSLSCSCSSRRLPGSDTQSAPGKLLWSLIVHGATAMRKEKWGGRKAPHSGRPGWRPGALRDTPAMDSSLLSQAFLA